MGMSMAIGNGPSRRGKLRSERFSEICESLESAAPADLLSASPRSRSQEEKRRGAVYTPKLLADFIALKIWEQAPDNSAGAISVLDPAMGDGELLHSLLEKMGQAADCVNVYGFETDPSAFREASSRLKQCFPDISFTLLPDDFIGFITDGGSLDIPNRFDLIIANPPYVRTQIMGQKKARFLAKSFGLVGRVDLYHIFILGILQLLSPGGAAGIIVPNRLLTTKSGDGVRRAVLERSRVAHIWDLGDTRLFEAAVLPALLLLCGPAGPAEGPPAFSKIYSTLARAENTVSDPVAALSKEGVVETRDGRRFRVVHGRLDAGRKNDDVWRIATDMVDRWLKVVEANSWGTFGDIGRIRVGVKTCADKVFIRRDWQAMDEAERPELLRPLTTHFIARRFRALEDNDYQILYPHETVEGRCRPLELEKYPRSEEYLSRHGEKLKGRDYISRVGRRWYEIWVPHNPDDWQPPKLVFRDIAAKPLFWLDFSGSVVQGDCYWLLCREPGREDLLWLAAAAANSSFMEKYYDNCFNNKLFSGRRRFISQYVSRFPLPDPDSELGRRIIAAAKWIYANIDSPDLDDALRELDANIWRAFGFTDEEAR
ncbi:type II restriction endonuclease subunit M [Deltaproteobacteria bacterium Smac51]|nr:type II restriction endonuclease subunit M [Deltaproteobacteria bacterium Smac51]